MFAETTAAFRAAAGMPGVRSFSDAKPTAASTSTSTASAGASAATAKAAPKPKATADPIEWLANRKSTVKQSQELFTTSKAPTYLKRPTDKYLVGTMLSLVGVGLVLWGNGLYSMALGKNKKE